MSIRDIFALRQTIEERGAWWIARFFLVYLGNPLLFFFWISVFRMAEHDSWLILKDLGGNTRWLNPITYILVTLPLYIAWIFGSIGASACLEGSRCFRGNFDSEIYFTWYVTPGAIIASIPGVLNLCVWCTTGMEGNIMGFIFFLPMLIASVVKFVMWIRAFKAAFTSHDANEPVQGTIVWQ